MFTVTLKNNKSFVCPENSTIFDAAKLNNIHLEHSCLSARCRSCIAKVLYGDSVDQQEEFVLSDEERESNHILTCNCIPISDISLDIEDLGNIIIHQKKTFPSKIDTIEKISEEVIKITLRFHPNNPFKFNAGQYVNLSKNNITRSYSVANFSEQSIEFYIKNYEGGEMSKYWFNEAKPNDLIIVEGPIGTFFVRESKVEHLIFLATGTGIAPIKSILEFLNENPNSIQNKKIWVFNGARHLEDLFWKPVYKNIEINYKAVLSREKSIFDGYSGYVQNAVMDETIDLQNAQVYACGSPEMIASAKSLFLNNNLQENNFFSDAFVQTN